MTKEIEIQEGAALQKAFISSKIDYTLEEKRDASDYADVILPTSVAYGENEEEYKLHKIIEAAFIAGQKKEQKPAEWSEEDKRAIDRACVALRAYSIGALPEFLPSELLGYADRLQSLCPQPHWKPSEEKKKETLDGADIGYGLETAIDILKNGFMHYQTDDGEYERKQALDVLIFLLNETRKKENAKLWSKDIVESIVTWATEKLQLYSMKESTPYVEAVKNNAQKVLDWSKEQWPIYYGWKPSDEQMEALAWYSGNYDVPPTGDKAIKSLYNDLKKL